MNQSPEPELNLDEWQQGDCCFGEFWFLVRFRPDAPLTDDSKKVAALPTDGAEQGDIAESSWQGFAILTQTCDIVRDSRDRPYLEIAPLVPAEHVEIEAIRRGDRPRYAFLPGLEDRSLVVDLDLVNTIEKAVLIGKPRLQGCRTDEDLRQFAQALTRKRSRFAFPTDIGSMFKKWKSRIEAKHSRESPEGRLLRDMREIRVAATPGWTAEPVELDVYLVLPEVAPPETESLLVEHLKVWRTKIAPLGRIARLDFHPARLSEMTALQYMESDQMDFDHLSIGK
jgi:hypothetical protein